MARVKGTVSQEILRSLLKGGAFVLAAQSPRFWMKAYAGKFHSLGFRDQEVRDAFAYLRRKNLLYTEKRGKQVYIRLTQEGEQEAGKFQINKLVIPRQRKWDKRWRLIVFDIPEKLKIKREAFRGKLKELGFLQLQKSIWVYPYPCEKQVKLLREFFTLTPEHLRVLEVEKIEEDSLLRKFFKLS